jgi:alpha-mannosidase
MSNINEQFDLIVDDGDHSGGGQIATALNLLPHMKKGGMYFIEDVKKVSKVMEALKDYKPFLFDWTVNGEGNDRLIFIQL